MRRAVHGFGMFVAILALVATTPLVVVKVSTIALDRFDRGPSATPGWWPVLGTIALPVFAVSVVFLIWASHRIGAREEAGFMTGDLRLPRPRRRRRLPRGVH